MTSHPDSQPDWESPYRLIAREKWKAQSAAIGQPVTDALVEYAQPQPGMKVLDPASGLQPGGDPFKSAVPGGLSEILRSAGFNSIDERPKRCRGPGRSGSKKCGSRRSRRPFPCARC